MQNFKRLFFLLLLFFAMRLSAQVLPDSVRLSYPFIHALGVEARPAYILPTNPFLKGEREGSEALRQAFSTHIRYSSQSHPHTPANQIYGNPYQGVGLSFSTFGNRLELGNPVAVYLFQGGRIKRLNSVLSFNYEWNFGISGGWQPYHPETNPHNIVVGSKLNAYLNTNFYLNWMISNEFDLISGVSLAHFSNGNTEIPNAGLNTVGLKVGLAYNFNRDASSFSRKPRFAAPEFPRHFSYDAVVFGSWRRKGIVFYERPLLSPEIYKVMGINLSALYNVSYKLRAGLSLDGVYDGSANIYTEDYIITPGGNDPGHIFYKPPLHSQLAVGLSVRGEYVMPYFTVNVGIGHNVVGRGDQRGFYQVLALKIETTRNSFIHIGYNLQNFRDPNYLMLGIGYRFNNKYPVFY